MTARIVSMKKNMAIGLWKKIDGSPSDITRDRRNPFSSMGASTKAIRKGIGKSRDVYDFMIFVEDFMIVPAMV